ncbi:hypothetical protein GBF38_004102 [Nibea albiflora]|uniref:Uncharacterized protein n=1 Tax=Nibea albiflora TaxID=240163 RepID=A0ACB7FBW0_NIBAL|nr:hypothetical protein GBF38_004102 [Nibea albiflora]
MIDCLVSKDSHLAKLMVFADEGLVVCRLINLFVVASLNGPWLYPDTIICSTSFPPTPPSSSSSPPPQPVAYLYPGDSKEPIKALQTSSA